MQPIYILILLLVYFGVLILISYVTGKNADNEAFFLGSRKSPWYVVAFGMIGASLSGVTFISVPGWVGASGMSYMQVVLGYLLGYAVIATILLPLYYRLNLTSIYTYLEQRYGTWAYKTGVLFFLFSRTIGAAARLFIVANVLQFTMLDAWGVPFYITVAITIVLIWLYTNKGGIKTIIWTDTLQTFFMLTAAILSVVFLIRGLGFHFSEAFESLKQSTYSQIFHFDNVNSKSYFWKHFIGGAFIAIAMTGLDQDMMQKNLSCRTSRDAQKNMFWFSLSLIPVNLLFLSLGAFLFIYASSKGVAIPDDPELLFPRIATSGLLPISAGIFFILGIVAAAYSSADSALTALTTSFSIDMLGVNKIADIKKQKQIRRMVHIGVSIVLLILILVFGALKDSKSVIDMLFTIAGYTYGPLLGLFGFGLLSRKKVPDNYMILLATLISPAVSFLIAKNSKLWFGGYEFGYELLLLNGLITFFLVWLISTTKKQQPTAS